MLHFLLYFLKRENNLKKYIFCDEKILFLLREFLCFKIFDLQKKFCVINLII